MHFEKLIRGTRKTWNISNRLRRQDKKRSISLRFDTFRLWRKMIRHQRLNASSKRLSHKTIIFISSKRRVHLFFKNRSLGHSLRRNYKHDVSIILIVWPVCRIHFINRRYLLHVRFYASQQKRLFPDLSVKRVWSSSSQQTCKLL